MAFLVTGTLDGSLYQVQVTGEADQPVIGNARVRKLIDQHTGRLVKLTATGPVARVDPADPRSILMLLMVHTHTEKIGPGAPNVLAPRRLGAVH